MTDEFPRWRPAEDTLCARCHENAPGSGGILCPDCRAAIEAANRAPAEAEPEVGR
jgi:predicted amidophosphoribosyltransferase